MDQLKMLDAVKDEIIKRLPEEALQKLANLVDAGKNTDEKVSEILSEYGVDPNQIVAEMNKKEQ